MLKTVCTNCRYVYNPYLGEEDSGAGPGTDFDDLPGDWICPSCFSGKEAFIGLSEHVNEAIDPDDLLPEEACHIPFYTENGDSVIVTVGTEDEPFVQDDVHFVEYIALIDDEEILEIHEFPDISGPVVFENPGIDRYEIHASCSIHGVWKGLCDHNAREDG